LRQLLPVPDDHVDVYQAYRAPGGTPLLRLNMVASADGSVTDEQGRAGMLGGAGDREVFRTLRALADAILVGAGTVRAEGYGPHQLRSDLRVKREADGRPAPAPIVVVSRSLDLDLTGPLFTSAQTQTVVLTCADSPRSRLDEAARVARVIVAGDAEVDVVAGLAELRGMGLAHILCEGGPHLNGHLLGAGVVDELCLTVAPAIVGTAGLRLVHGLGSRVGLELAGLLENDGELFCRYRVRGAGPRSSHRGGVVSRSVQNQNSVGSGSLLAGPNGA
jgi:riboflavin-specific deaminase-like protein